MKAEDLIIKALKDIGADGLCEPDMECGCSINDLAPCDMNMARCLAAKKEPMPEDHELYEDAIRFGDDLIIYVPMVDEPKQDAEPNG